MKENILDLIGNTPMVKVDTDDKDMADIYLKLEYYNLTQSVKDRAVLSMILGLEETTDIKPGDTIVESTSGNTGIALASIGALRGYKVLIVMPESMSVERRAIIKSYGAELILTDKTGGMSLSNQIALEKTQEKGFYFLRQFDNPYNPLAHYNNTANEIIGELDSLDAFVVGVGTGGTISGAGKRLKEVYDDIVVVGVEPKDSNVMQGGKPGPHAIQGIGAGFLPKNLDLTVVDDVLAITNEEAINTAKYLHKHGVFSGISGGANMCAALKMAKKLGKGKKVVSIIPDNAFKYLSTDLFR